MFNHFILKLPKKNSEMLGLQQCVSNKNGTAISNPVLHRDCRNISGSTPSNGKYFNIVSFAIDTYKKESSHQYSQMAVKVVQLHLRVHLGQTPHNIQHRQHHQDHQLLDQHHLKDPVFLELHLIPLHHNTMDQTKQDHSVHQVKKL